jgi:hypothetical protein
VTHLGRLLLAAGVILVVAGLVLLGAGRLFPWLGRLPGDIRYQGTRVRFYFPLTTMLLVSLVGSLLLTLLLHLFRR